MKSAGLSTNPGIAAPRMAEKERGPLIIEPDRPGNSIPATLVSFYIFLVFSRVLDILPIGVLHVPMVMLILLVVMTAVRGNLKNALSTKVFWFFAAFTVWVLVCFPLSSWRAASVDSVTLSLQAFAIFLIIVQTVRSPADWRKVAGAYAYAVLAASILSFYVGQSVEGRISLVNGTLADPNEFAMILAVGLPFWFLKASRATALKKLFFWLCTVPVFMSFARAGSRSGLITLAVLLLVIILFANPSQKVLIALVAVIATVAAAAFLPSYLKARFTTIFSPHAAEGLDEKSQEQLNADIDSSQGRELLLVQSIHMTFEHPIFGVGPGVFAAASWDERHKMGVNMGGAMVSHNTYTQISSETGLPGFLFFTATLFLCVKYTLSDYRKIRRVDLDLARNDLYMLASISALAAGIFFLSVGYSYVVVVMFALATSLRKIVRKSLTEQTETVRQAEPLSFRSIPPRPALATQPRPISGAAVPVRPPRVAPRRRARQRHFDGRSEL